MKSQWTGAISLSLINLPVKVGSATKDNHLGLHMVRKSDGSRIRFTRVAEVDGKEVPWHETAKGYDAPDGSMVILDSEDFTQAYGPKKRVAEVLMFTDAGNIPPMAVKSAYWVQPDKGGDKTYALLAHVLQQSGKVAVLSFAMRDREAVAVLRPHDGYLSLETLEWDADLLRPDFPAPADTATEADHKLALQMIKSMEGKYDHSAQTDKSSEAVMTVIQGKIERGQVIQPPADPDAPKRGMPANLTAALQASVDAHQGKTTTATRPARRKAA